MCFASDNAPSCYYWAVRKARTPHRCDECYADVIRPGDRYEYISGVWDGRGASYATCLGCVSLREAVKAHEIADGCDPWESVPAIGDLMNAAIEMEIVCYVKGAR